MAKSFVLTFLKKEKIARDTYSFYFDKSNYDLKFNPGEYIQMKLEIKNPDSRGSSRYFTIAAPPLDTHLIITTKVIRSSFKKSLLKLEKNKDVRFFGPMGNFVMNRKDKRTKVFLAGGIGMTTFYSMIKFAHQKKDKGKIILITSFSSPDFYIYKEELEKISKENPNINVFYTTSRIDEKIIRKHVDDIFDKSFYVVGSEKMVEDTKNILLKMKIPEESISLEDFTGY